MRFILTLLFLSSTFYLGQAKLTNIEGVLIDLEKLEPLVVQPTRFGRFYRRWSSFLESNVSNIINGQDAAGQTQFPHQAALFLKKKNDKIYSSFCGGSLISSRTILTAAHCLDGVVEVEVCLGCMNFNNDGESGRKVFKVQKSSMIVHEEWNPTDIKNDIALLILPEKVPFSEVIKPLNLPEKQSKVANVLVSGWGKTKSSASGISKRLKYIDTRVIEHEDCVKFYKSKISINELCTDGSQGKSTCGGDSGGPLVVKSGGEYIQIGIVSFGSPNCEKKVPSVYTHVFRFLPWIEEKMDRIIHRMESL